LYLKRRCLDTYPDNTSLFNNLTGLELRQRIDLRGLVRNFCYVHTALNVHTNHNGHLVVIHALNLNFNERANLNIVDGINGIGSEFSESLLLTETLKFGLIKCNE